MRVNRALLFLAGGVLITTNTGNVRADPYEPLPVFTADQILESNLRKSAVHQVQQAVRNDGYMYQFKIDSEFGRFTAVGKPELLRRINEIDALARLNQISSTQVATEKAKEVGTSIATAPVRSVKFLSQRLKDTEGTKEMVKAVPGGVANLFRSASSSVKSVAGTGSKKSGSGAVNSANDRSSATSSVTQYATGKTLEYTGYNKVLRHWYQELGVDPFTDNEELQQEIRRVAKVESTVGFAGKFVPGPPSIPGVKDANKYINKLEDVAAYDDPKKVQELYQSILRKLGKSEKETKRFIDNEYFTPTTRTLFLSSLDSLGVVKNIDRLLATAGNARSRAATWYHVHAAQKLADFHQKEQPLDQIVASLVLPAGITGNGQLYVPIPVDYLVWSEEVAGIFRDFQSRVAKEHKITSSEIRIAGKLSKRCREELQKLGLTKIITNAGY